MAGDVQGETEVGEGLVQVEDVDVGPGSVEVRFHERVPTSRLVSKVDSRFEQLFDARHVIHVEIVRVRERVDHLTGSFLCVCHLLWLRCI